MDEKREPKRGDKVKITSQTKSAIDQDEVGKIGTIGRKLRCLFNVYEVFMDWTHSNASPNIVHRDSFEILPTEICSKCQQEIKCSKCGK